MVLEHHRVKDWRMNGGTHTDERLVNPHRQSPKSSPESFLTVGITYHLRVSMVMGVVVQDGDSLYMWPLAGLWV